ncbi:MAG: hypothetical protein QGI68_02515 [Pseudomonadales bacterium]|jgi:hypothetical protein|nr:hypothetical protein [Pseudomonadales bacterium]MDP7360507.1 hypothetical protein [Pseudomonadales bacterium]MDP7594426.1 hypothetical protein [Pseudomonadales bacterium]HJN50970.1 hypothetical protein [Pseudomonadales bacterium]|tara:strand:- start:146 stop:535 length:390 start_codon:yes stop_codon:yes gene_type:complete
MASSNAAAGIDAVNAYIDGFNRLDIEAMSTSFNFPHVRLARGEFYTFDSAEQFSQQSQRLADSLAAEGWDHTVVESADVIHEGEDKVHVAMTVARRNAKGETYNRFNTLWIATLQDGHWGIQFRSSYLV